VDAVPDEAVLEDPDQQRDQQDRHDDGEFDENGAAGIPGANA
jgi:hypothetical protein